MRIRRLLILSSVFIFASFVFWGVLPSLSLPDLMKKLKGDFTNSGKVVNGDFEDSMRGGLPRGWRVTGSCQLGSDLAIESVTDGQGITSGKKSLRIKASQGCGLSQTLAFEKDKKYELTADILLKKGTAETSFRSQGSPRLAKAVFINKDKGQRTSIPIDGSKASSGVFEVTGGEVGSDFIIDSVELVEITGGWLPITLPNSEGTDVRDSFTPEKWGNLDQDLIPVIKRSDGSNQEKSQNTGLSIVNAAGRATVQPVYFLARDQEDYPQYRAAVTQTLERVADWYRGQLGITFETDGLLIFQDGRTYNEIRCGDNEQCLSDPNRADNYGSSIDNSGVLNYGSGKIRVIYAQGAGGVVGGGGNGSWGVAIVGGWILESWSGFVAPKTIPCGDNCTRNISIGTVAHELGHAFTLEHLDPVIYQRYAPPYSVMDRHFSYPNVTLYDFPDAPEKAILRKSIFFGGPGVTAQAPKITNVDPVDPVRQGSLTIYGENFGNRSPVATLLFNDFQVPSENISAWVGDRIEIIVPESANSGYLRVVTPSGESNYFEMRVYPESGVVPLMSRFLSGEVTVGGLRGEGSKPHFSWVVHGNYRELGFKLYDLNNSTVIYEVPINRTGNSNYVYVLEDSLLSLLEVDHRYLWELCAPNYYDGLVHCQSRDFMIKDVVTPSPSCPTPEVPAVSGLLRGQTLYKGEKVSFSVQDISSEPTCFPHDLSVVIYPEGTREFQDSLRYKLVFTAPRQIGNFDYQVERDQTTPTGRRMADFSLLNSAGVGFAPVTIPFVVLDPSEPCRAPADFTLLDQPPREIQMGDQFVLRLESNSEPNSCYPHEVKAAYYKEGTTPSWGVVDSIFTPISQNVVKINDGNQLASPGLWKIGLKLVNIEGAESEPRIFDVDVLSVGFPQVIAPLTASYDGARGTLNLSADLVDDGFISVIVLTYREAREGDSDMGVADPSQGWVFVEGFHNCPQVSGEHCPFNYSWSVPPEIVNNAKNYQFSLTVTDNTQHAITGDIFSSRHDQAKVRDLLMLTSFNYVPVVNPCAGVPNFAVVIGGGSCYKCQNEQLSGEVTGDTCRAAKANICQPIGDGQSTRFGSYLCSCQGGYVTSCALYNPCAGAPSPSVVVDGDHCYRCVDGQIAGEGEAVACRAARANICREVPSGQRTVFETYSCSCQDRQVVACTALPQFGTCGACSSDAWGGCTPPAECRLVNDQALCQANNKPDAPCCLRDQSCAPGQRYNCGYAAPGHYCDKCHRFQNYSPWCTDFQLDCGAGSPARPRLKSPANAATISEAQSVALSWYAFGEGLPEKCGESIAGNWPSWEDCHGEVHWNNTPAKCISEVGVSGGNAGDRDCWGYVCARGSLGIPPAWRFYKVLVKGPADGDFREVCSLREIPNPPGVGQGLPAEKTSCLFTPLAGGNYQWFVRAGYSTATQGGIYVNQTDSPISSFTFSMPPPSPAPDAFPTVTQALRIEGSGKNLTAFLTGDDDVAIEKVLVHYASEGQSNWQKVVEVDCGQRHCSLSQGFTLPQDLAPGNYTFVASLWDHVIPAAGQHFGTTGANTFLSSDCTPTSTYCYSDKLRFNLAVQAPASGLPQCTALTLDKTQAAPEDPVKVGVTAKSGSSNFKATSAITLVALRVSDNSTHGILTFSRCDGVDAKTTACTDTTQGFTPAHGGISQAGLYKFYVAMVNQEGKGCDDLPGTPVANQCGCGVKDLTVTTPPAPDAFPVVTQTLRVEGAGKDFRAMAAGEDEAAIEKMVVHYALEGQANWQEVVSVSCGQRQCSLNQAFTLSQALPPGRYKFIASLWDHAVPAAGQHFGTTGANFESSDCSATATYCHSAQLQFMVEIQPPAQTPPHCNSFSLNKTAATMADDVVATLEVVSGSSPFKVGYVNLHGATSEEMATGVQHGLGAASACDGKTTCQAGIAFKPGPGQLVAGVNKIWLSLQNEQGLICTDRPGGYEGRPPCGCGVKEVTVTVPCLGKKCS